MELKPLWLVHLHNNLKMV
uniref:Uncharacterized protein n=1 Tax=Anguilla anguilla TaxID=7936 RepID=A0A0E9P8C7_ANGAN